MREQWKQSYLRYEIEHLKVTRYREGNFRTWIFDKVQWNRWINHFSLFKNELSTKKVSEILKTIFQNSYSRSRISIITEITREEVKRFQNTSLDQICIAIFLYAIFFYLIRDTVGEEPIISAIGIVELERIFTSDI